MAVTVKLGANAFEKSIDIMQAEFPLIVYGHALQNHTGSNACAKMFTQWDFVASHILGICKDKNSFNHGGSLGSTLDIVAASNLMNIYLYGPDYNETLYNEFIRLSGMSEGEFNTKFRNATSVFG